MIKRETTWQMPRRRAVLVLLAMAASLLVVLAAKPAHASNGTLVVNSTADLADQNAGDGICDTDAAPGNLCTLRAAIEEANASSGLDVIAFNIPGSGVHTIQPSRALPAIRDQVIIEGYSQSGASPNTLQQGNNAVLNIELDGSKVPFSADGLAIEADNSTVRGLAINRFSREGTRVLGDGNKIEGNFIGTDPGGILDRGNSDNGLSLRGSNNTVGGALPGTRNLVSSNKTFGSGVQIVGNQNKVLGNYIGTDKNGTGILGNDREGVDIFGGSDNVVGDGTSGGANTIAFNKGRGVNIKTANAGLATATGNRVLRNSIFFNGGLGIDLGADGVTANDDKDPDTGPNNLQNKPVVTSAKTSRKGTTITGKLNSNPNEFIGVEFFSNPSGTDVEGKTFIGELNVTTDDSGKATFTLTPIQQVPTGQKITAMASNAFTGDTSEFSAAKKVVRR
jgi:CSLREA domain-containing protein